MGWEEGVGRVNKSQIERERRREERRGRKTESKGLREISQQVRRSKYFLRV